MGTTAQFMGAASKLYGGMQTMRSDNAAAGQLQQQGGEAIAAGIQGADQALLKGDYVASRARAATAAGGLTTTSMSAERNVGQIEGQAEYNALAALYHGQSEAQDLDQRASVLQSEGRASMISGAMGAAGAMPLAPMFRGVQSFFDKYGNGRTPTDAGNGLTGSTSSYA